MKKFLIILVIFLLIAITACSRSPPIIKQEQYNCSANGYVSYHDVNELINISNRLIVINNLCTQNSNLTPIPYIAYLQEK